MVGLLVVPLMLLSPCSSEHEKNRRRDLVTALRNRREQMQMSLKRDHSQQNRYRQATIVKMLLMLVVPADIVTCHAAVELLSCNKQVSIVARRKRLTGQQS